MDGRVFAIERCSLHDGPGIRTTVFFKGCPLRCLWCHNPESQEQASTLYSLKERCIRCGACIGTCPQHCHQADGDGTISIDRRRCTGCGACTRACPADALEVKGSLMSAEDVLAEIARDKPYYDSSGGGMTISGGEPLSQWAFAEALLRGARKRGIHTCVETSGFAPFEHLSALEAWTDLFYFDIKETNSEKHLEYTGVKNTCILENLAKLDRYGATIVLRCPVIPGFNDRPDHFAAIAELANRLQNVCEINLLPYHPLGESKSHRIGETYPMPDEIRIDNDSMERWAKTLQEQVAIPVLASPSAISSGSTTPAAY